MTDEELQARIQDTLNAALKAEDDRRATEKAAADARQKELDDAVGAALKAQAREFAKSRRLPAATDVPAPAWPMRLRSSADHPGARRLPYARTYSCIDGDVKAYFCVQRRRSRSREAITSLRILVSRPPVFLRYARHYIFVIYQFDTSRWSVAT